MPIVKNISSIHLIVVLGGDGTYLEAVRMLKGNKIPILGVNFGSLGFLTETPIGDLYTALQMTLDGKMEMRPRSMIELKIKTKSKVILNVVALNDIVIERGARSHLIHLELFSERLRVGNVKSDGIIISTPTGSTAYNLAAGGPILHPEVHAFVVTPICPHSLTNRPIIFPDDLSLIFKLKPGRQTASLTADGRNVYTITPEHEVIINRHKNNHYVLKKPSHNYFNLLTDKLKFGERD